MDWDRNLLGSLPTSTEVIPASDDRVETYREDTMYRGSPDAVMVARDEKDAADVLKFCNSKKIPVTICGSRTSMTGSSIPNEGLLISTERLEGLVDISNDDEGPVAVVRPGTIVAELQKALVKNGYFYPVAPTSRDECRIGSNVNTNATGEDSYKYGPVRNYVKAIELVMPDGTKKVLSREKAERASWDRNRAGYFTGWKNPIDLVIGSEGTLGFLSRIWLKVLKGVPQFFSGLIPFPSNRTALDFVIKVALQTTLLRPRTLELVDSGALKMMKTSLSFPSMSDDVAALLYIKQEFTSDTERNDAISMWYDETTKALGHSFADRTLIAMTPNDQEDFRLWRHRVPEAANELGRSYWKDKGGKVGSDWWVPVPRLSEMMEFFYKVSEATGLFYMGYAHIGAGHPHTNLLARDAKEKAIAHDVLIKCCSKAAELGGGVAGEHGIGKIHTDLVPIQHSPQVIEQMKKWKLEFDPNWIMARGNIFDS